MKSSTQSGLSVLKIIVILAILAVLIGLISTFTDSDEKADVTQDSASATQSDTPLETFAANKAADLASPVTDAVAAKNDAMEAELAADANVATPEAVEVPEVAVDPAPSPAPAVVAGTFEAYDASKLALAADGTVVLFFHADWCPSCRGLESDINAKLSQIPANTHILKLDYDIETELKKKYGVVRQHTLIVVDANGNEIKRLTGLTNTLAQVTSQL